MRLKRFWRAAEHRALVILWAFIAAWIGAAIYVLGVDFWVPSLWPVIFAGIMTKIILRMKRERLAWEAKNLTANIDQKPTAVRES